MEAPELLRILLRRWWLVVLVPAIALPLLIYRTVTTPYQSTVRAAVLIPGDTEIPGNSERPELMVLDDLPSLIGSRVFASAVSQELANRGVTISDADVQASLLGTRYSRILTVHATSADAEEARAIASAAETVLPSMVNQYLVADPSPPATVQVIDPAGEPTRSRPNQWLVVAVMTVVAAGAGAGLALVAEVFTPSAPGSMSSARRR